MLLSLARFQDDKWYGTYEQLDKIEERHPKATEETPRRLIAPKGAKITPRESFLPWRVSLIIDALEAEAM